TDRAMFHQETRLVYFLVAIKTGNAKRVRFDHYMLAFVGKQLVGDARDNPQAGAQLNHPILRPDPIANEGALLALVIARQKASPVTACRYVFWNRKRAAVRVETSSL